jgi:hypothetical protein
MIARHGQLLIPLLKIKFGMPKTHPPHNIT